VNFRIVVLMKPTPDPDKVRFDAEKGTIIREGVELIINPYDLPAIELAVQVKEKLGGEVIVISMAPPQGEEALRDAIARGADRAILLTDRRFAGADTLATSYALASAIRKLGNVNLVIGGEKSIDGDTAQVPGEVAEMLGLPHVSYVSRLIDIDYSRAIVESDLESEVITYEVPLPCVLQVTLNVAKPRIPTIKGKLQARKAIVEKWSADALADIADINRFGIKGSPTMVYRVVIPKEKERKRIILDTEQGVKAVVDLLMKEGLL
jgi:electron transfer flavoprotein beta subunit